MDIGTFLKRWFASHPHEKRLAALELGCREIEKLQWELMADSEAMKIAETFEA